MNTEELNNEINDRMADLQKDLEIKYNKRRLLNDSYEHLKSVVKKSGLVSLCALLVQGVLLTPHAYDRVHPSLAGLCRFLTAPVLFTFIIALVIFIWKGWDLLVNSDTDIGNKIAEKTETTPVARVLKEMTADINKTELDLKNAEEELYDNGGLYKEQKVEVQDRYISDDVKIMDKAKVEALLKPAPKPDFSVRREQSSFNIKESIGDKGSDAVDFIKNKAASVKSNASKNNASKNNASKSTVSKKGVGKSVETKSSTSRKDASGTKARKSSSKNSDNELRKFVHADTVDDIDFFDDNDI